MKKYTKTDYQGIDYGLGQANIDLETGIRYGVIPVNDIPYIWDELEPVYFYICPYCGYEFGEEYPEQETCPECSYEITDLDFDCLEPIRWEYSNNEYSLVTYDGIDLFVIKSPYYTYAQFCSPCAPGACYLPCPLSEPNPNNKCYCLGPEYFDDNLPYEYWKV